jgi:hypothetical protein
MESGPVVSETSATAVVRHAAAGKLSHTMARYQAALAAAEESVQRAQATLAIAEELLRRARDLQHRFRELRATRTGGVSTADNDHCLRQSRPMSL